MLKITVVRKQKGLTQSELSKMTGIPKPQISAIENRRVYAWKGWQKRIADALGWMGEPSELFEDVEV